IRAAALFALTLGWPTIDVGAIADAGRRSIDSSLRVASVIARVKRGVQDDEDLASLLELTLDHLYGGWSELVTALLVEGWSGSQRLRDFAVDAVKERHPRGDRMDISAAWSVLLTAFPGDQVVAALCVE